MKIIFLLLLSISSKPSSANPGTKPESLKPITTCYRIELVKTEAYYEMTTWQSSTESLMCGLSFSIEGINPIHIYYSRSWYDPSYCKAFLKDWNRFSKRRVKVCIAGGLDDPTEKIYRGRVALKQSAPWEVVRIGKWCREHFAGSCDAH